jgi:hypothetical protein
MSTPSSKSSLRKKSITQDEDKVSTKDVGIPPLREWTDQIECILAAWADIALCYSWLHDRSFRKYSRLNYQFSIPVIVLSTLTGTANFGVSSAVPPEFSSYAQMAIGLVSICTGVISTLQTFFRYAQKSESHSNSSMGWGKLHRNISIELSLERQNRKAPKDFMRLCRVEYDRLTESSPIVPTNVIDMFWEQFRDISGLRIPDIFNRLEHTTVYRDRNTLYDTILPSVWQNAMATLQPDAPSRDEDSVPDENGCITSPLNAVARIETPQPQRTHVNERVVAEMRIPVRDPVMDTHDKLDLALFAKQIVQ